MSAHEDLKELLGAYALDALEPDEAADVERHLSGCAECRIEVAQHREVASLFSDVTLEPPAGIWEQIVQRLDEPPAQPARPLRPAESGAGKPGRTVSMRTVAALAAAAVIVIAGLGVTAVRLDQRKSGPSTNQAALQKAAQVAVTTPGARRTTLRSSDGRLSIDVVILPDGHGYLVGNDLPRLPNGQTYQLWAQTNNQLVSFGVLGESPGVSLFRVESPVVALAVTSERAGGVPAPTMQPLLSGPLPSG
ncbi:MAG TPA: anti-sigma factor [Acidimicrobiales bacterium]|nr:anti-sigma factor [Acidimicrobiales bacterium]